MKKARKKLQIDIFPSMFIQVAFISEFDLTDSETHIPDANKVLKTAGKDDCIHKHFDWIRFNVVHGV